MNTLINNCIMLNDLKFDIDYGELSNGLNISSDKESNILKELIQEVKKIAAPKALFKKCYINSKCKDYAVIDNEKFFSRVVSTNLCKEHIAFPYIVTCGMELQQWHDSKKEPLLKNFTDYINQSILIQIQKSLEKYIEKQFYTGSLARVNPGSTIDWDIKELEKIFNILDNPKKIIGVTFNDKFFMTPSKTNSGIYFHNEDGYKNCLMCPGINCPLREAPYDKDYYNRKYKR